MAGRDFNLGDYIQVPERLAKFYELYPDGRVSSSVPVVVEIESGNVKQTYVQVTTTVWRSPDDTVPCQASAWELFPGKTPYTKESEMMNAETSAVGRALWACGIEAKRGAASQEDVQKARAAQEVPEVQEDDPHLVRHRALMAEAAKLNAVPEGRPYVEALKAKAAEHGFDKFSVFSIQPDHIDEAEGLVAKYLKQLEDTEPERPELPGGNEPPKTTRKARAKPGSAVQQQDKAREAVEGAFPGTEEVPEDDDAR